MNKTLKFHPMPPNMTEESRWFLFQGDAIVLIDEGSLHIPSLEEVQFLDLTKHFYIGQYHDKHCYAAELSAKDAEKYQTLLRPLKRMFEPLGEENFVLACKIKQLLRWHRYSQFCGLCGNGTSLSEKERAKICSNCQLTIYPELSPAIIVLIQRDKEILLARSPHFQPGMYSLLAGFVEPGESLEDAVNREVYEEVGLFIKNIQYAGSQSWPFPNSLMLGFTAEYSSGEIKIDGEEIIEAGWFNKHNLPQLPNTASIARKIIEDQLKNM